MINILKKKEKRITNIFYFFQPLQNRDVNKVIKMKTVRGRNKAASLVSGFVGIFSSVSPPHSQFLGEVRQGFFCDKADIFIPLLFFHLFLKKLLFKIIFLKYYYRYIKKEEVMNLNNSLSKMAEQTVATCLHEANTTEKIQ